jgi:predicted Zn-dependent protease
VTAPADVPAAPTVTPPPPPPEEPQEAPPPPDPKVKEALDLFATARDVFKKGDYAQAEATVEKAIGIVPDDPVMHEFRALTLFAQGKYRDAAATLYAVLSRGPGWDWETMRSLYGDPQAYTNQLRALEKYARDNPTDSASRFVLAYHYLVTRQTDAAVRMLEDVVRLTPDNQLAADMAKALKAPPSSGAPQAGH